MAQQISDALSTDARLVTARGVTMQGIRVRMQRTSVRSCALSTGRTQPTPREDPNQSEIFEAVVLTEDMESDSVMATGAHI